MEIISLIITAIATVSMAIIGFLMYRLSVKSAERTDKIIQHLFKRIEAALYASGRSVGELETFIRESGRARKVIDGEDHKNDGHADTKHAD